MLLQLLFYLGNKKRAFKIVHFGNAIEDYLTIWNYFPTQFIYYSAAFLYISSDVVSMSQYFFWIGG
jgi:hypothetical protein